MNIKTNTASKLSNRKTTACVVSTSYGYVTYHMNTLIIVNMLCLPLERRMPNICFHVRPFSVWIIRIWLFDFYICFNIMTLLISMELSPNLSFRFFFLFQGMNLKATQVMHVWVNWDWVNGTCMLTRVVNCKRIYKKANCASTFHSIKNW